MRCAQAVAALGVLAGALAVFGCASTKTTRLIAPGSDAAEVRSRARFDRSAGPGAETAASPGDKSISEKREERKKAVAAEMARDQGKADLLAAEASWQEGDVHACRQRLESVLARDPDCLDARLLMAELLLEENCLGEATDQLRHALATHPDNARPHYLMGLALDAQGEEAIALACYERAASLDPGNEVYAAAYQSALRPVTVSGSILTNPTGSVLAGDGLATAAGSFFPPSPVQPAAFDEPADSTHGDGESGSDDPAGQRLQEGMRVISAGNADAALSLFRDAAALKPGDPWIPLSAAVSALRHNRPDVAIELLAPAVAACPASADLWRALGAAYYRRGDYPASRHALERALSLDKSSGLSYLLMGWTLARLGECEAADAHFRQAAAIDPRYGVGY